MWQAQMENWKLSNYCLNKKEWIPQLKTMRIFVWQVRIDIWKLSNYYLNKKEWIPQLHNEAVRLASWNGHLETVRLLMEQERKFQAQDMDWKIHQERK